MRIGPYELTRTIGEGGMGHVYAGRAPGGGEVAIKVLMRGGTDATARFERERRLLASLGEADGFVPLLDAGATPNGPYIVMPFVPGGTLRTRLDRGPLGVEETVALGRALATALGAAHARGIVHRDLKPENVLFTASGKPLIADLGLAKHFDKGKPGASQSVSLSQSDALRGTAGYMAPEQIVDSRNSGPPADVFALGAILFECLAGEPAFSAESVVLLLTTVIAGTHAPLRARAPGVPAWLAAIVERAIARDARDRFPDGLALARALASRAAPARRRAPLVVALAILLAGAAGLAWVLAPRASPPPAPPPKPAPNPVAVPVAGAEPHQLSTLLSSAAKKLGARDWAGAAEDCSRAIELDPTNAAAWAGRAAARGNQGDLDGELADATRSVELAPEMADAWALRGEAFLKKGDDARAIEDLTKAVDLDPRNSLALGNRAAARLAQHDYDGAVADGTAATAIDPRAGRVWAVCGTARLSRSGEEKRALEDLSKAIECEPSLSPPYCMRGFLRRTLGDPKGALADFERFLELAPNDPQAPGAREALAKIRAGGEGTDRAAGLLTSAKEKAMKGDLRGALADCDRAIELEPGLGAAWVNRAIVRGLLKDPDGARSDYDRAIELDPRQMTAWAGRATIRLSKKDWSGAISDDTRALELAPRDTRILLDRATARESAGDRTGALEDLTAVLEIDPGDAETLAKRGVLWNMRGEKARALADLERFLELAPDDPRAQMVRDVVAQLKRR